MTLPDRDCELSVVLPVFDAADYVESTVDRVLADLETLGRPFEVVIVDDASNDDTVERLRAYGDRIRLIELPENRGKGHAVKRGMLASSGLYRVFTDADLPYTLAPLATFLDALESGADLAIGARDLAEVEIHPSLLRSITSKVFGAIASTVLVPGIRDTQCGFKAFRSEAAETLFTRCRIERFAFDVEVLYLARRRGMRIERLPVELESAPPSTVRLFRDALLMLRDVVRIRTGFWRGRYD